MAVRAGELSVREQSVGGPVSDSVHATPEGWIDGTAFRVVLLVHGFNNNLKEAQDSYGTFTGMLPRLDAKIGWLFWPGDADFGWFQFADFLSYPTEIPDARESARRLADFLVTTATEHPTLQIILVGHSLGCRLILETLRLFADNPQWNRPDFPLVMLMAAAVPTDLVEHGKSLDVAGDVAAQRWVFCSTNDLVLHFAFPAHR